MKRILSLCLVVSLATLLSAITASGEENAIFTDLVKKGVPLSNGKTIKLSEPVMADGLNQAAQEQIITGLIEPKRMESFMKGGLSDYFELKKSDHKGAKKEDGIGRQIDLYFVAQGKLDVAGSTEFTKKLLNQNDPKAKGKAEFFTGAELERRKLSVTNNEKLKEKYAHAFNNILGKVLVSGSGRGIKTFEPESVLIASKLDPRFATDDEYPNQWQSIKTVNGRDELSSPQKYAGLGGYIKITKLAGPQDRVFVEYHLVFDEPYGWFKGGPNLIAHLDDVYPKDVRKFRRELLPAGNQVAAGVKKDDKPDAKSESK